MNKLIVSFTSYPARINAVKTVLDGLYAQTLQADEIILWLAEEEFQDKEADLPYSLQSDLMQGKFTVRWCDNLGSHKKYYYVMQEYPDDIIVTVDDDLYYHPDSLEKLMDYHERFPNAVVALITTMVRLDAELQPLPRNQWLFDFQQLTEPSMLLVAGNGGGTLFPPHSVSKKIFDKNLIKEVCSMNGRIFGDDILLKVGEVLNHTPVVSVPSETYYRLPDTQDTALWKILPKHEHHNQVIKKLEMRFRNEFNHGDYVRLKTSTDAFDERDRYEGLIIRYWIDRPLRDLDRQIGYLSLPWFSSVSPNSSDYSRVQSIVRFASMIFSLYPPKDNNDSSAQAIERLQKRIAGIPGIEVVATKDISVRGLIEYGVMLNTNKTLIFRGIPIYKQVLNNWQLFLEKYPQCDAEYREAYNGVLDGLNNAVKNEGNKLSKDDIEEWNHLYEAAIKINSE